MALAVFAVCGSRPCPFAASSLLQLVLAASMLNFYLYLIYFDQAYPNPRCCNILQVAELFCGHTRVELLFVGI